MESEKRSYPGFELINIRAEKPEEIPDGLTGFVRVELPSVAGNVSGMAAKGFAFGDRTLGVTINLVRVDMDLDKLIRFEIHPAGEEDKAAILEIALNSFPTDRRFHVKPEPDQETANDIIRGWVDRLTNVFVCIHKEQVVGFLDLEPVGEKDCFIHLAAVTERYRAAGAALALYAFALREARKSGKARVLGRISSTNTAVMNLYARLGAVFSDPIDVFLRDSK